MSAARGPSPVGLPTLRAWRRTGLVLCMAAVTLFLVSVGVAIASGLETIVAVLAVGSFVLGVIGLGFLRRAWSDPEVEDDPSVVRARRLSDVAMTAWGVAIIPNAVFAWRPDLAGTLDWLPAVSVVLGFVAVVAFLGMLAVAVRWSPSDH